MKVLPYGDRAVLIDCDSLAEAQAWFAALHPAADVTLGARSVLVRADPAQARALIANTTPAEVTVDDGDVVEIPVVYDGRDLADVARLTGLSEREVIAAHTDTPWRVAFGGFAPGFAYLTGGDARLHVPRLASPRRGVQAGSVALAGEYSGVYPRPSPGGWRLIGRTDAVMWDSARTPPALLQPGNAVRFVVA
jgi:KipI family sensor histidine kinase inhibitor